MRDTHLERDLAPPFIEAAKFLRGVRQARACQVILVYDDGHLGWSRAELADEGAAGVDGVRTRVREEEDNAGDPDQAERREEERRAGDARAHVHCRVGTGTEYWGLYKSG